MCPRISPGVGRVVTGTFTHVRGGILRIRLAGLAEPLGVTSNHSIYSADRLDFVPAGELSVGETLWNLDGDVRIESIEQLGTQERVYNLEIHSEHVFRVASSGLLVHNSSGAEAPKGTRSRYDDVTTAGSRYPNRATDVSKANFEKNLVDTGWARSVSKDGKTVILQKDGARYVIRDGAKSTGGPTADYHLSGSQGIDLKIRLGQGGTP